MKKRPAVYKACEFKEECGDSCAKCIICNAPKFRYNPECEDCNGCRDMIKATLDTLKVDEGEMTEPAQCIICGEEIKEPRNTGPLLFCRECTDAILSGKVKEALEKQKDAEGYFQITSVHRADISRKFGNEACNISNGDMIRIADLMRDAYVENFFWDSMESAVELVTGLKKKRRGGG